MVWVGVWATRGGLGRPISGSHCLHAYGRQSGRLDSWAASRGPGSRYGFSRRRWEGSYADPDLGCSLSTRCRWRAVSSRPDGLDDGGGPGIHPPLQLPRLLSVLQLVSSPQPCGESHLGNIRKSPYFLPFFFFLRCRGSLLTRSG